MVNGKGTAKPYVHFISNASTDVTGSMHHIRFKRYSILLDCGLIQLNDPMTNYKANAEQLKKIKPTEIDYVILSHCHIDHSGLIPALFARGSHATIYIPRGCGPFLRLLWLDSMKIMQSDCIKISNKHGIKASQFYTEADIENALAHCIEVEYETAYTINKDIEFTYYSAGHIIHSTQILLALKEGNIIKRIGFTGDIGGEVIRRYVDPRENLPFCDLLIGENTYNTPSRPNKPKDRYNDLMKIASVVNSSNKILIPTFSLGRTQEVLTMLYEMWQVDLLDDIPIYLDSPLSQKICSIWDDEEEFMWGYVWNWKNLHIVTDWIGSMALQKSNEHCIILSASGFLSGGRVLGHLKEMLPHSDNHILFVGYAGENNLTSQIKSKQKEVNVEGKLVQNKANITELRSFSSHASYAELLDYYTMLRYNKIALVHGNQDSKVEFCHTLQDRLHSKSNSAKVVCTNNGQKIYF